MISIDQWIYETIGSDSLRQAASLASLSQATLSRQLTNKSVTVETAVKIARAYQVSIIPALMALGIVTENDISEFASEAAIQDASDEILSAEVLRRMKAGSALINAPIDEVEQHLAEHKRRKANELKPEPKPDDPWAAAATVSGKSAWRGDEMVADDSEEEGFLGDDNYSDGP